MSDCWNSPAARPALWRLGGFVAGLLACSTALGAADPADARRALLEGNYSYAINQSEAAISAMPGGNEWPLLLVQAQLAVGRNADADTAITAALARDPQSLRLRWLARDVAFANGQPEVAMRMVEEIRRLFAARAWAYRDPADLVVFGRAALLLGADPKDVLDKVYAAAQKADPKLRDVYLARGDLAMEKHDFVLAAKAFEEGLKQLPDDPDLHFGRATAYAGGEHEAMQASLAAALKQNSRHVPSLLLFAAHHIDAEDYVRAAKLLDEVIAINPVHPDAWAYRAVLAHLRNDPVAEGLLRATALRSWPKNPRVDFLIGQKLSQKYRFAEGAEYQRRAREFDPAYLPASAQLASDLLRLGEETEGWKLAQAVHDKDDYDVEAYNLITLRDTMAKYSTITNEDFVVRMAGNEAAVYGPRVLALLKRAHRTLTAKYGVELAKPTFVEIFADQKDFAVRTFGLPDIPGFLGVCFGRVVTANGPAAVGGHPVNWESVLWHEFCHVVTLQLTKNKMPRWLSEGISVYEETQADPSRGMAMSPRYRAMILGEDLVPVGGLSAAFLSPKTPEHLQFAYLESAMVVEFIVGRYGIDHLRGVLRDLRDGAEINTALEKNVAPLATLEKEFAAHARGKAEQLAPKLDWEKPDADLLKPGAADDLAAWEKKHPDNYWTLTHRARDAAGKQNWAGTKTALQRLVELYPRQKGGDAAYRPLVAALHQLGETEAERAALTAWAAQDDEATEAYLRLMELARETKDWPTVTRNAERYLAVNPLVAPPWRYLAEAATAAGDQTAAIAAWRTLLNLDVPDAADAHFQLAQLLHRSGADAEARQQTLLALEETPRFRDALKLLLELAAAAGPAPAAQPPAAPPAEGSAETVSPPKKS